MNDITVIKTDLLVTVKANREKHKTEYAAAIAKYKEMLIAKVNEKIEEIKTTDDVTKVVLIIGLPVPEEHTSDFDTVIEMLEWAQGDTLELGQGEFNMYVRNQWSWARTFAANTSSYTK